MQSAPASSLRAVLLLTAVLGGGCAFTVATFPNATPGQPLTVSAEQWTPEGAGPFPAVVMMHGCHGISTSTRGWGRWFRDHGYVALAVDSWTPRGMKDGCSPKSIDLPNTERLDDMVGALRYLVGRPEIDRARIGVIGWSNGGAYALSAVNGPSHERARRRGVVFPEPGFRASVALYPGGCASLVHEQVVRPLLVLIGDADDWTLADGCVAMVNAMRARGADASIVVYPGVVHYFDVVGQPRMILPDVDNRNRPGGCCGAWVGYDRVASVDAHRRIEAFLASHLAP